MFVDQVKVFVKHIGHEDLLGGKSGAQVGIVFELNLEW